MRQRLSVPTAAFPQGETREQHAAGLSELLDALSVVPPELASALHEALRQCPDVCETESDPHRFLRCEQFSGYGAALRLAQYWAARKHSFGPKAFGPLANALEQDDVACLTSGYLAVLPRDAGGRPVRVKFCGCDTSDSNFCETLLCLQKPCLTVPSHIRCFFFSQPLGSPLLV